jgi:hypothetical protein
VWGVWEACVDVDVRARLWGGTTSHVPLNARMPSNSKNRHRHTHKPHTRVPAAYRSTTGMPVDPLTDMVMRRHALAHTHTHMHTHTHARTHYRSTMRACLSTALQAWRCGGTGMRCSVCLAGRIKRWGVWTIR